MGRDRSIESLRGLAIILVVALHLINDPPLASERSFYEHLGYAFQHIRIPLFTVISGYLYAFRPLERGNYLLFSVGKFRRIVVPLLVVSSLEFIATSFAPGVSNPTPINEIWRVWFFPYGHFWFLQAIFLIFLLVGMLDCLGCMKTFTAWLVVFLIAIGWHFGYPQSGLTLKIFSAGTTSYILPYFLFGYALSRFGDILFSKGLVIAWFAILGPSLVIQELLWFQGIPEVAAKTTILGLCISVSSCALLFAFRRNVWGLSTIGTYAFTIYLYQSFGAALGRRIPMFFPDINPHVYFIFVLTTTILFGIVVELVVSRIPIFRKLMLGIK